jgi:hypothetical protein
MNNFMNYCVAVEPRVPSARPACSSVRRVIRNLRSSEYFRGGQWTPNAELADQFPDAGKVVEACIRHHLVEVELVLQFITEPSGVFETHLRLLDQPRAASDIAFGARIAATA